MTNQILKLFILALSLTMLKIGAFSQNQFHPKNNIAKFSILLFKDFNQNLRANDNFREYPFNLLFEKDVILLAASQERRLYTVAGKVNGHQGYFIIDSGSQQVILNSSYRTPDYNLYSSKSNSLTGKVEVLRSKNIEFELGNYTIKNANAELADLSLLEDNFDIKLLGLIGFEFLKDFEVVFNYPKGIVALHTTDQKGNWKSRIGQYPSIVDSIDFELKQGFPVISVEINGKKRSMVFDTGSEYCFTKHKGDLLIKKEAVISGVNGNGTKMSLGRIPVIKVSDKFSIPSVPTVLTNHRRLTELFYYNIDGIIGQNVFAHWIIGINYQKRKIYFYDFLYDYQ